jgi:hypothetical protein
MMDDYHENPKEKDQSDTMASRCQEQSEGKKDQSGEREREREREREGGRESNKN